MQSTNTPHIQRQQAALPNLHMPTGTATKGQVPHQPHLLPRVEFQQAAAEVSTRSQVFQLEEGGHGTAQAQGCVHRLRVVMWCSWGKAYNGKGQEEEQHVVRVCVEKDNNWVCSSGLCAQAVGVHDGMAHDEEGQGEVQGTTNLSVRACEEM